MKITLTKVLIAAGIVAAGVIIYRKLKKKPVVVEQPKEKEGTATPSMSSAGNNRFVEVENEFGEVTGRY